jgi:hypothetical protein
VDKIAAGFQYPGHFPENLPRILPMGLAIKIVMIMVYDNYQKRRMQDG